MTDLLVTADTNTIASGIVQFRVHPDAITAQFIRAWQAGHFLLVQSEPLVAEISRTLAKPYFAQRLKPEDHADLQQLLARRAHITPLTVAVEGVATHPKDDVILVTVREFLAMLPGLPSESNS